MNRTDNRTLPHHNVDKQARRIKIAVLDAKIIWLGPVSYNARNPFLKPNT